MQDALILANNEKFDVFNCLNIMDNSEILKVKQKISIWAYELNIRIWSSVKVMAIYIIISIIGDWTKI